MAKIANILNKRLLETFSQVQPLIRQKIKTGEINENQGDRIQSTLSIFLETLIDSVEEIQNTPNFLENVLSDIEDLEDDDTDLLSELIFDDAA